jgi:hypothetical protein
VVEVERETEIEGEKHLLYRSRTAHQEICVLLANPRICQPHWAVVMDPCASTDGGVAENDEVRVMHRPEFGAAPCSRPHYERPRHHSAPGTEDVPYKSVKHAI